MATFRWLNTPTSSGQDYKTNITYADQMLFSTVENTKELETIEIFEKWGKRMQGNDEKFLSNRHFLGNSRDCKYNHNLVYYHEKLS